MHTRICNRVKEVMELLSSPLDSASNRVIRISTGATEDIRIRHILEYISSAGMHSDKLTETVDHFLQTNLGNVPETKNMILLQERLNRS